MIRTRLGILALVAASAGLMGQACVSMPESMRGIMGGGSEPIPVEAPSAIEEAQGEGRKPVFREKNLNATGHRVYKALRQQETLNAFLECQGEPDYVEVKPGQGDNAPVVVLTYTRRSAPQRGTVNVTPSPAGYYVASPIKPPSATTAKPPTTVPSDEPKQVKKPPPAPPPPVPPTEPEPEAEAEAEAPEIAEPEAEEREPEVVEERGPQPSEAQLEDCPIEDWRRDCEDLCVEGATWEWCSY